MLLFFFKLCINKQNFSARNLKFYTGWGSYSEKIEKNLAVCDIQLYIYINISRLGNLFRAGNTYFFSAQLFNGLLQRWYLSLALSLSLQGQIFYSKTPCMIKIHINSTSPSYLNKQDTRGFLFSVLKRLNVNNFQFSLDMNFHFKPHPTIFC